MDQSLQVRIDNLEVLYSEQDYTVQALNDRVAQQDREISGLTLSVELLKDQLKALKMELSSNISPELEKPPHY